MLCFISCGFRGGVCVLMLFDCFLYSVMIRFINCVLGRHACAHVI